MLGGGSGCGGCGGVGGLDRIFCGSWFYVVV